jgi:hypothetical protein
MSFGIISSTLTSSFGISRLLWHHVLGAANERRRFKLLYCCKKTWKEGRYLAKKQSMKLERTESLQQRMSAML